MRRVVAASRTMTTAMTTAVRRFGGACSSGRLSSPASSSAASFASRSYSSVKPTRPSAMSRASSFATLSHSSVRGDDRGGRPRLRLGRRKRPAVAAPAPRGVGRSLSFLVNAARASDGSATEGDVVAYGRKGETRVGKIEKADGKAAWVVVEAPDGERVKVTTKSIELNFGREADAGALEAFARATEEATGESEERLSGAWELINEFGTDSEDVIDAFYVSELVFDGGSSDWKNVYAAHRLLKSDVGGVYFKGKAKGAYEPRTGEQIEALRGKIEAERRAEMVENAFLEEIKSAIAAPLDGKPAASALWRPDDEDNDARVRRFEALQAYALGEKFHSPGQKAMADDLLGKLGFQRSPESAIKTLISTGSWSKHENLSVRRYEVPVAFSEDVLAACAAIITNPPIDVDESMRSDLTHLKTYAIDDAGTVEIDDAISVQAIDDDTTRVWVHIADPTRWVERGSPVEVAARRRATTLYYPSEVVPMFPFDIAAGPMSLGGDKCEAMTVRADVNASGEILDYEIMPSFIKLAERYTYDQVNVALKDANGDADLKLLYKVADARDDKRADDGSVTIVLPENSIEVQGASARGGGDDVTVNMSCIDSDTPARMLVAEMMVLVGDIIGQYGARENIPLPYRGQNEPRLMSDDEWDAIPEGICQDIAMRTCMSSSSSGVTPRPHSGLGLEAYVQFTSPIRRFSDFLAHQQVKARVRGEPLPYDADALEAVMEEVGTNVGGAIRSQRETTKYWAAVYFQSQPADARWTATVVKFIRGDDLVLVIFDRLGFETIVKLDRGGILGESLTLRFVDADPHAGNITFARAD